MKTQSKLLGRYFPTAPTGRVEWIGVRPERKSPMSVLTETHALENRGLSGDRTAAKNNRSARQVTVIAAEDIRAIASTLGKQAISPALLRRNIVISGINLHSLRYQTIQIGEAVFEIGAHCHPCSRMESALGKGGFLAMYMRGGYCCKVLRSGTIAIDDTVTLIPPEKVTSEQQNLF